MSDLGFLGKLLDGVEVERKPLGSLAEIKRGTSITKKDLSEGDVPVIAGGRGPAYYHRESNRRGQTIVVAGSGAYAGFVSWWEEPIFVSDAFSVKPRSAVVPRYCFHWLQSLQRRLYELQSGGGVPHVYPRDLASLQIPIPCPEEPEKSLAIQGEIVRILDSFTELTAELTAELAARKKQYNHYRDKLLTFEDGEIELETLGQICTKISSGKNKNKSDVGLYPVYGSTGIIGRTDEKAYDKAHILVARVGANAGRVNIAQGEYDVSDNTLILHLRNDKNLRYLYHYLINLNLNRFAKGAGQPLLTAGQLKEITVPMPPSSEKARIVTLLDKFDTLTTSTSEGLPREITLRQQQYEYYRDLLLSFPQPAEAAEA